tara:strand:+ start:226 stop:1662 length:1437 start_codon:yes stop_codon:yes gene_type:complete
MANNFLNRIRSQIGSSIIVTDKEIMAPYLIDWRGNFRGHAKALLFPTDAKMISAIMQIADEQNQVIVPQGGNTGLVGGGIPNQSGDNVILSLQKMNSIIEFSRENRTITVQAGCILQHIHETVEKEELYFPLSLAAKGSCTIGGNLATNAGGLNVLRYGTMREQCLGLQIVLSDGTLINQLAPLRKDNTGYDLKNLFIGSEGTLGIITAACLKLVSKPKARTTAIAVINKIEHALQLLDILQHHSGDQVESFEIMPKSLLDIVYKQFPDYSQPVKPASGFILIIEISSSKSEELEFDNFGKQALQNLVERFLEKALEENLITDAVIATNEVQRHAFWALRENAPEATKRESWPVNTDISVRRDKLAEFYYHASDAIKNICKDCRICGYGHVGDGNLHFNVVEAEDGDPEWPQKRAPLLAAIYDSLSKFDGSISAEHGIGQLKTDQLKATKDANYYRVMTQIKDTFDPKNLLNPDRIIK